MQEDFDDFWTPSILKSELESENSKYIVAKENDLKDPDFVNFAISSVSLTDYQLFNTDGTLKYDFHLQAGSKALVGEGNLKPYSGTDAAMQPLFLTSGITVNGKTYNSPAPVARYGAFGQE